MFAEVKGSLSEDKGYSPPQPMSPQRKGEASGESTCSTSPNAF